MMKIAKMFRYATMAAPAAILLLDGHAHSQNLSRKLELFAAPYQTVYMHAEALPGDLGNDPIIGTLACPPLTKLNLLEQKVEHPLLESLHIGLLNGVATWSWQLTQDLLWWDGSPVNSRDLLDFINDVLESRVAYLSGGKWQVPAFEAIIPDPQTLVMRWQQHPEFGPYILNGVPLAKKRVQAPRSWMCAGPYELSHAEDSRLGYRLVQVRPTATGVAKFDQIVVSTSASTQLLSPTGTWLNFRHAQEFSGTPAQRRPNQDVGCERPLDLPIFSVIAWNPNSAVVDKPELRQNLTMLTPRGAILRLGAGHLGNLVSGPLLRAHPGYNRTVLVRPFDFADASSNLDALGYRRPSAHEPRQGPNKKRFSLRLRSQVQSSGLIEKAVGDAFAAVGVSVHFAGPDTPKEEVDGIISAVAFSWPEVNLIADLHSSIAAQSASLYPWSDHQLDRRLEAYSRSLSTGQPDFSELRRIHRRLFELEAFTMLMQHHTCLESGSGFLAELPPVVMRDPHWFSKLIMGI